MSTVMCLLMFGTYPALKILQYQAREEMKDSLIHDQPSSQLTFFSDLHNNKDVSWEESDKEFHYKGEMYDVVRIEKKEGKLLYYCLSDKKETELYSLMDEQLTTQNNSNKLLHTGTQKLLKIFIQVFTPCEHYRIEAGAIGYYPVLYCFSPQSNYSDCYKKVVIPPPKTRVYFS